MISVREDLGLFRKPRLGNLTGTVRFKISRFKHLCFLVFSAKTNIEEMSESWVPVTSHCGLHSPYRPLWKIPILFVCSPKFCISIVFSFSWDLQWSQEKTQTMLMQNLGGQTKSIMVFSEVVYSDRHFKMARWGELKLFLLL